MELINKGNVNEIYKVSSEIFIIVKTDRISAKGKLLPFNIKDKGVIQNQISNFWFNKTKNIIKNHILETNIEKMPDFFHRNEFRDRTIMVQKAEIIPFEFIVRGYIYGRMWTAYQLNEKFCGVDITGKYQLAQKLKTPIITPTTKMAGIYDKNVSIEFVKERIGKELTQQILKKSLELYNVCSYYAYERGLIIADTKFEFGLTSNQELILVDEIFTPDSSRFWEAKDYFPGSVPKSYDKQLIRDWLSQNRKNGNYQYDKIPLNIIKETEARYYECRYKILS